MTAPVGLGSALSARHAYCRPVGASRFLVAIGPGAYAAWLLTSAPLGLCAPREDGSDAARLLPAVILRAKPALNLSKGRILIRSPGKIASLRGAANKTLLGPQGDCSTFAVLRG